MAASISASACPTRANGKEEDGRSPPPAHQSDLKKNRPELSNLCLHHSVVIVYVSGSGGASGDKKRQAERMDDRTELPSDSLGLASAERTERMAQAVASAARAYVMAMVTELAQHGFDDLTPSSVRLLSRIDADGSRASALARTLGRTKQAVGQTVVELELRGYVDRLADPHDARARLIRCTTRGKDVLVAGVKIREDIIANARDTLDADELLTIERGLEKLTSMLRSEDRGRS